ncbi:MAG TPA: hypothetical protein VMU22_03255 [Rhizomicrobium sp.]|nr:hypothetical protein [Rhizomicrobium sp.]
MASATFLCPECNREYRKSADFIVSRKVAQVVQCPGCGCIINCAEMFRGDFDSGMTAGGWQMMLVVGLIFTAGIMLIDDWEWWQAGLIGFLSAGVLARIWSHYELRRDARKAASEF